MRRSVFGLVALAAIGVVGGFMGGLHHAADSLSIGRPLLALICLLGVLVFRARAVRFGLLVIGLVGVGSCGIYLLPQSGEGDLRVYSKNLWFANTTIPSIVADIEASGASIVMLQEVSDQNKFVLDLLAERFPYQSLCRFSSWSGVALASQHPIDGTPLCSTKRAVLAVPIRHGAERIWFGSLHLPWPWPYDSRDNEIAGLDVLSKLDGPVVVGGDFNSVPWSKRVRDVAAATGTQVTGPMQQTLFLRNIPLPIDMVLAPGGGKLQTRPLLGSDHFGLIADIKL